MWLTVRGKESWTADSCSSFRIPLIVRGFLCEGKEETADPKVETAELLECLEVECCLTSLVMVEMKAPF